MKSETATANQLSVNQTASSTTRRIEHSLWGGGLHSVSFRFIKLLHLLVEHSLPLLQNSAEWINRDEQNNKTFPLPFFACCAKALRPVVSSTLSGAVDLTQFHFVMYIYIYIYIERERERERERKRERERVAENLYMCVCVKNHKTTTNAVEMFVLCRVVCLKLPNTSDTACRAMG